MVQVHVFADPWGINPSPFCLKVETYCRLAGISFAAVPTLPFRAPKGKLPFINDGNDRNADSGRSLNISGDAMAIRSMVTWTRRSRPSPI